MGSVHSLGCCSVNIADYGAQKMTLLMLTQFFLRGDQQRFFGFFFGEAEVKSME